MASKDFSGTSSDSLATYDSNFSSHGTQGCSIDTPNGSASHGVSSGKAYHDYEDGFTGLDQSCECTIVADASGGSQASGVVVHGGTGVTGVGLYITVSGSDVGNCSLRTIATGDTGGWTSWLANIGNTTVSGGAASQVVYKVVANDNGDGTMDVDVWIDGTEYTAATIGAAAQNITQSVGNAGFVLYDDAAKIYQFDSTDLSAGGGVAIPTIKHFHKYIGGM